MYLLRNKQSSWVGGGIKELKEEKRRIVETDLFGMAATLEKTPSTMLNQIELLRKKKKKKKCRS